MKVSRLIELLQEFQSIYGDLEVWMSDWGEVEELRRATNHNTCKLVTSNKDIVAP